MRLILSRVALALLVPVAALDTASCAEADSSPAVPEPASSTGHADLGEFVAHVSPRNRTIRFERVSHGNKKSRGAGVEAQSVDEITIAQDDIPGSGPANTVELVTNSVGTNGECPAGFQTKSFCGNVTLRSFYAGRALSNVYAQVTKITDTAGNNLSGHSGINSSPSYVVGGSTLLSNNLGLWRYTGAGVTTGGVIAQSTATNGGGNAGTLDWVFANPDDADTAIYIHVFATLTYSNYTFSSLSPTIPTVNNACLSGGFKHATQSSGTAVFQRDVPFPFTFYGTTYTPGTSAGKLTFIRAAGIGFGALSTLSSAPFNTGTNILLPNSASNTVFKPGIYPFWENLNYTTNNGSVGSSPSALCSLVSGSEPNRSLIVTWHDMKYFGETSVVYPASPTMNISAILHEGSDVIDFVYGIMTDTNTQTRANGALATIGVQNETGTAATVKHMIAGSVTAPGTGCMYTLTPNP